MPRAVFKLFVRGICVSQMVVWTYTANKLVLAGVGDFDKLSVLYARVLWLWAFTLTGVFSAVTVQMCHWRQFLSDSAHEQQVAKAEDADADANDGEAGVGAETGDAGTAAAEAQSDRRATDPSFVREGAGASSGVSAKTGETASEEDADADSHIRTDAQGVQAGPAGNDQNANGSDQAPPASAPARADEREGGGNGGHGGGGGDGGGDGIDTGGDVDIGIAIDPQRGAAGLRVAGGGANGSGAGAHANESPLTSDGTGNIGSGCFLSLRSLLSQLLSLTESTFGWVAGCSWTNAVVASKYSSLNEFPTGYVCFKNFATAVGLTALAVGWLVASGSSQSIKDEHRLQRDLVERYFLTTSMSFFVGWSWLVLARNLSTQLARAGVLISPDFAVVGEALCVLVFGPALTIAVLALKQYTIRTYVGSSRRRVAPDSWQHALAKAIVPDNELDASQPPPPHEPASPHRLAARAERHRSNAEGRAIPRSTSIV
eukprot:4695487-Pleurochrysis_carterae.AAC.1